MRAPDTKQSRSQNDSGEVRAALAAECRISQTLEKRRRRCSFASGRILDRRLTSLVPPGEFVFNPLPRFCIFFAYRWLPRDRRRPVSCVPSRSSAGRRWKCPPYRAPPRAGFVPLPRRPGRVVARAHDGRHRRACARLIPQDTVRLLGRRNQAQTRRTTPRSAAASI